jgi:LmbE family N-acetylglucosaminyl deacetylase
MKLQCPGAEIYIPGEVALEEALKRTTHLAIGAHQDDLEIMAVDGVLACYQKTDKWFTGIVVTNGSGSPRNGIYSDFTDDQMMAIRVVEQKRAAFLGDYSAQAFLGYPSSAVKDKEEHQSIEDIKALITATTPEIIYTHNLADKHHTHIGVAIKVIRALREIPEKNRPKKLYGCEVWRDLGWMLDNEKIVFDCSEKSNLQQALLGVFDSQISGGKRYDLASMGRRISNATYYSSHDVDQASGLSFAMDLTPLIIDIELDILSYVDGFVQRFAEDVAENLCEVL